MTRCTFCDHQNPAGAIRCGKCGAEQIAPAEPVNEGFEGSLRNMIERGDKIDAIRLYREQTGADLKEAKDAVEAMERGEAPYLFPAARVAEAPVVEPLERELLALLNQGKKIEAIKVYRAKTGLGLAEAKAAVDALASRHGVSSRGSGCAGVLMCSMIAAAVAARLFL